VGEQGSPRGIEEAEAAAGAVNSDRPGCRPTGPPHLHLRRHHGWQIESFYKLLKSAGQQVERWEQASAEAIAKRLAVASLACLAVWQLMGDESPAAEQVRGLLVRLSGRQMKRGVGATAPALLAGLEKLLAVLDVLADYPPDELRRLVRASLPHLFNPSG
jgi:hypothetical protein